MMAWGPKHVKDKYESINYMQKVTLDGPNMNTIKRGKYLFS
jgi:hypothetical protein